MSNDLSDIRREFERVSVETVLQASAYASSILADVAGRRGAMEPPKAARTWH